MKPHCLASLGLIGILATAAAANAQQTAISVCNNTGLKVWAAIAGIGRDGTAWSSGWWEIGPGACVSPTPARPAARVFARVESEQTVARTALVWSGPEAFCAPRRRFEIDGRRQCGDGAPEGFRELARDASAAHAWRITCDAACWRQHGIRPDFPHRSLAAFYAGNEERPAPEFGFGAFPRVMLDRRSAGCFRHHADVYAALSSVRMLTATGVEWHTRGLEVLRNVEGSVQALSRQQILERLQEHESRLPDLLAELDRRTADFQAMRGDIERRLNLRRMRDLMTVQETLACRRDPSCRVLNDPIASNAASMAEMEHHYGRAILSFRDELRMRENAVDVTRALVAQHRCLLDVRGLLP
jgi:uncharacterized membrane protein